MHLRELKQKPMVELVDLARSHRIEGATAMRKQELVFALLCAHAAQDGQLFSEGVLECLPDGFGFLRAPDSNYLPGPNDIYVSPSQVRRFHLRTGDAVCGSIRPPKEREAYFALLKVDSVNGQSPEERETKGKVLFDNLTPTYPQQKLSVEHDRGVHATRIIDMLCPIGKGQRCLVVSPPRAGKTMLLQQLGNAIADNHPDARLVMLLIDERPEEVTDMQRAVRGEVVGSTFDEPPARHVQVAEMVLEKAKRLVEQGHDVVILLDSLTRLTRAYNAVLPASGRVLSGGLDSQALHRPKRFFGAARNIEEGGSLTIVATALVDTGSRMDEVIFEEFKGTGNCEIHLDRKLLDRRIFPCFDVHKSATRKAEMLQPQWAQERVWQLRQLLQPLGVVDSMELLLDRVKRTQNNQELLESMSGGI